MLKIFVVDNTEKAELESIEKGCRLDILVEIDGVYYKPVINTIERLSQEVYDSFSNNEIFVIDPCQVIVKKACIEEIIKTIEALKCNCFFDCFVPTDLSVLYNEIFTELSDIKNWVCVYQNQ